MSLDKTVQELEKYIGTRGESRVSASLKREIHDEIRKLTKVCLVYPGRFQPFHKGHLYVYQTLKEIASGIPECGVFFATGNSTEGSKKSGTKRDRSGQTSIELACESKKDLDRYIPKSPFTFEEKKELMMLAGIAEEEILCVSSPCNISQIRKYFREDANIILVVGSKTDDFKRFFYLNPVSADKDYLHGWESLKATWKSLENEKKRNMSPEVAGELDRLSKVINEYVDYKHFTQNDFLHPSDRTTFMSIPALTDQSADVSATSYRTNFMCAKNKEDVIPDIYKDRKRAFELFKEAITNFKGKRVINGKMVENVCV